MSEKLELVATLEDKTRQALVEMVKNHKAAADAIKKHNLEVGKQNKEAAKEYKDIHERLTKVKEQVSGALTPAMASLGIATYGVGTGLAKVVDLLKDAGASYNVLNDVSRRTGASVGYITATSIALERWGVAADKIGPAMSEMGDHLAKISRNQPAEMNALHAAFGNLPIVLREYLKGADTAEERMTRLFKFGSEHPEIPIDKLRRMSEALGMPAEAAGRNKEEIAEGLKAGTDYIAKYGAPNMALNKQLAKSFDEVREALQGFGQVMVNTFGPPAVAGLKNFSDVTDQMIGGIKKEVADATAILKAFKAVIDFDDKISGAFKNFLDNKVIAPTANALHLPESMGGGASFNDRFDALKKPVAEGVEEGLDKFKAKQAGAGGFAPGLTPQAFHPSGGGGQGGMFGSKEYPAVGGGIGEGAGSGGGGAGGRAGGGAGGGAPPVAGGQGGMIPDNAGAGTAAYTGQRGSEYLKAERSRYAKEFAVNPALKQRLAAIIDLENPKAGTAVGESLMNRMNLVHRSIESGMAGGPKSFYGPARHPGMVEARLRELQHDPKRMAARMAQIDAGLGGSNFSLGNTDQGSRGDPNYYKGGTGVNINGERFNDWGVAGSRAYREHQQAMVAGEGLKKHGANIREFVNRGHHGQTDGRLLQQGRQQSEISGAAHVNINLAGFPRGTRTSARTEGDLFKTVRLDRGRPMAVASQDS